ncbi:MAG TPA: hypothetical protein VK203_15620 [Nostocaceae cyanobacterium]|nr:hypothetical protein [Nostocaceae cyanobacterium]
MRLAEATISAGLNLSLIDADEGLPASVLFFGLSIGKSQLFLSSQFQDRQIQINQDIQISETCHFWI